MSEFHFHDKVIHKNMGNVHYGDVSNREQREEVVSKAGKWNMGHTLALIGIIVTVVGVIIALLAWLF